MRPRTIPFVVFVACLAAVVCGGERRATSYLPQNLFLAVVYDRTDPALKETTLSEFFREPEMVEATKAVRPLFDRLIEAVGQEEGLLLRGILGGEAAFGIGAPVQEKGDPNPLIVLRVGTGDAETRKAAEALMSKTVTKEARADTLKHYAIGAAQVTSFVDAKGDTRYFAFDGPMLLLAMDEATLKSVLDPATPKLDMGAERPCFLVRYDHAALMKAVGNEADAEGKRVLTALGLDAVRTAEIAVVPRGKRLVWRVQADLGGAEPAGLTKLLASGGPLDRKLLERVPKSSDLMFAFSLDYGAVWDEVWATIERIEPRAAAEGRQGLGQFNAQLGVDIRQDILGAMAPGTVLVSSGSRGWMGGWAAIVQRVRDGEKLDRSIAQAATRLDLMLMRLGPRQGGVRTLLKPFTYRGRQCKYLWMMGWPALTLPGWAPCYANLGDEFVFAINPLQLKGYIDFVADKQPTILENAEFQELMKGVPAAASSISYGRLTEVIVAMYNTAAPILMIFQGFAGPMGLEKAPDLANLPSSGLVRRYAQGAVTYGVFEKGTYRIECVGNGAEFLGPHVVPVGVVAGAAAIVLPAFTRARGQAQRIHDRNNLFQIAKGMATYLNKHGDNRFYPKSMAELVEKGILGREVFVSPLDRAPPMVNGIPCSYVSCLERHPDRVFLDDFPPNIILAWDRISFRGNGFRNVMFFDSHVEWVHEVRFQQLLQELDGRAADLGKREPQKAGEL